MKIVYVTFMLITLSFPIIGNSLTFPSASGSVDPTLDGVASLILPSKNCWGCNKDAAKIYLKNGYSGAVFQWRNKNNLCPYVRFESNKKLDLFSVDIITKSWFSADNYRVYPVTKLPVTIPNRGEYTLALFNAYKNQSATIFAYCTTSDSHGDNRGTFSTNNFQQFGDRNGSDVWGGNGSIISGVTGACTDFGCTKDWAKGNLFSRTAFQWQISSRCRSLVVRRTDNVRFNASVYGKFWDGFIWKDLYNGNTRAFPSEAVFAKKNGSDDGKYYLISISPTSIIPKGVYIEAKCK